MAELQPHPLNASFSWDDTQPPFRRVTPEQARAFDERGFFLLEGAFDAATLARVTAAIDPIESRVEDFLRGQRDGRAFIARAGEITFTTHLVKRSPVAREFVASPVFRDLVHDLIGPDVRLYWDQAVYKKPETPRDFPWHQDNGYVYLEPQRYLTCWVALTDATLENGCPWVAPGVHRRGTLRHWMTDLGWQCLVDPPDAVPVEAPAGSIVVFSSLTPHRTGPNVTGGVRKAYIVQFAPDGAIRLEENRDTGVRTRVTCDVPDRQFFVLKDGAGVAPPPWEPRSTG